jgi:hypothetical protein
MASEGSKKSWNEWFWRKTSQTYYLDDM